MMIKVDSPITVLQNRVNVAAHLLLTNSKNEILLQRRFNTDFWDGSYGLPSGHTEPGEAAMAAMVRECLEETSVTLDPTSLSLVHVMYQLKKNGARDYISIFFRSHNWTGEPKIMEPNKCDELRWCDPAKLPPNVIPYIAAAIERIGCRVEYSEYMSDPEGLRRTD
jgi:8-oxo-dGTP pyrophosphatase MutT (NUDIX family)